MKKNQKVTTEVINPEVVENESVQQTEEKKENVIVRTAKSVGSKAKAFATKHKKGLLIGTAGVTAAALFLKLRADGDDDDEDYDDEYEDDESFDSDVDNSDSDAEE